MRELNLMSAIFTHNMFNITGTQTGRVQSKVPNQDSSRPKRRGKECRKQEHTEERNANITN